MTEMTNEVGGVCALINRCLQVLSVELQSRFCELELLSFDLILSNSKVRFFLFYRRPKYDAVAASYMNLFLDCNNCYSENSDVNIIASDMNAPSVN